MLTSTKSCQLATLAVVSIGASLASAQALDLRTGSIKLTDGTRLAIDHGRLKVPENRQSASSREITLAFVRVKSKAAQPGPPVFYLAGGPGGSSIRAVTAMVREGGDRFLELLGGDIVGIDQRGVGKSDPNLETATKFGLPLDEPGNPTALINIMQRVCREEADRWRQRGVDLNGYTTVESADDINAVRAALGYDKITLWGSSYGTHLALATIRRHEPQIARALLVGPEGPDHTLKLPTYAEESLAKIGTLVAKDAIWGDIMPDLVGTLREVLTALEEQPQVVSVAGTRVGISKFDIQQLVAQRMGHVSSIKGLPAMVKAMSDGDFSHVAAELLDQRRESGIWSVMQMMMDCSSDASPERRQLIQSEASNCLLGDAVNFPFDQLVQAWDAPDLGPAFRSPVTTEIPVLIIVGDLDSRTPIRNAEELVENMPNGHVLAIENAAHDLSVGEVRDVWSGFLHGEQVKVAHLRFPMFQFDYPEELTSAAPEGTVSVSRRDLARCVGSYVFENGMTFKVRVAENRLIASIPGKGDIDLWPRSATTFFCLDEHIPELEFRIGTTGKATAIEGAGKVGKRAR